MNLLLGVNIDHIATIRQARMVDYPSIVECALIAEKAGADSITLHLREDRRHIQDDDVLALKQHLTTKMNLEMAATAEMIKFASFVKPKDVCIVPESREELTTEGGLDVFDNMQKLTELCDEMNANNVKTSLFIDADLKQIDASKKCGAKIIEIHTGHYADDNTEFENIKNAIEYASSLGLQVNAGHGLTTQNIKPIAELPQIIELNIGHSIIARAIVIGLHNAVYEMKNLMIEARK